MLRHGLREFWITMSVSAHWHDTEKDILEITFHGRWYWKELDETITTVHELARTATKPYDLLIDIRDSSLYEPNAIEHVRAHYLNLMPPNLRLILCIGADYYTQILWKVFTDLPIARHLAIHYFDTEEQALTFSRTYTPPA